MEGFIIYNSLFGRIGVIVDIKSFLNLVAKAVFPKGSFFAFSNSLRVNKVFIDS